MTEPKTRAISQEAWELIGEHREYFQSIRDLYQETGLSVKPMDPEAEVQLTPRENGDVEITYRYPVDNNDHPSDGRLYLHDSYVFDGAEQRLKEKLPAWKFSYNEQGNRTRWEEWWGRYQAEAKPGEEKFEIFSSQLARSYRRPFTDEIFTVMDQHRGYLKELLQSAREGWTKRVRLKTDDPLCHYTLLYKENQVEVTIHYLFDKDEYPENGRLWLKEKIILRDREIIDVIRTWEPDPDSGYFRRMGKIAEALNEAEAERVVFDETYHQDLLSVLLPPEPSQDFEAILANLKPAPSPPKLPSWQSLQDFFDTEKWESTFRRQEALQEGLNMLYLASREKMFSGEENPTLDSLVQKALENFPHGQNPDLASILRRLDLNTEESALREAILFSPWFRSLNSVSGEDDGEFRRQLLSHCSARFQIISLMQVLEIPQAEWMPPLLLRETTGAPLLAGMILGPLAGAGVEGLALARLAKWRSLAPLLGVGANALAFTGAERAVRHWETGSGQVWSGFWADAGWMALMFGVLRVWHGGLTGVAGEASGPWKTSARTLAHHGMGVAGMGAVEGIRKYVETGESPSFSSVVKDGLTLYGAALIGFAVADRLTGGALQRTLAAIHSGLKPTALEISAPDHSLLDPGQRTDPEITVRGYTLAPSTEAEPVQAAPRVSGTESEMNGLAGWRALIEKNGGDPEILRLKPLEHFPVLPAHEGPSMTLTWNGVEVYRNDWETTGLVLGRNVVEEKVPDPLKILQIPDRPGIAEEHAVLLIDSQGKWKIIALENQSGTSLQSRDTSLHQYYPEFLQSGDKILLDLRNPEPLELKIEIPDYANQETTSHGWFREPGDRLVSLDSDEVLREIPRPLPPAEEVLSGEEGPLVTEPLDAIHSPSETPQADAPVPVATDPSVVIPIITEESAGKAKAPEEEPSPEAKETGERFDLDDEF